MSQPSKEEQLLAEMVSIAHIVNLGNSQVNLLEGRSSLLLSYFNGLQKEWPEAYSWLADAENHPITVWIGSSMVNLSIAQAIYATVTQVGSLVSLTALMNELAGQLPANVDASAVHAANLVLLATYNVNENGENDPTRALSAFNQKVLAAHQPNSVSLLSPDEYRTIGYGHP